MLKTNWEEFWKKISVAQTPGTTPIDEKFWKLLNKDSNILEVGCGWGRIIFECLKRGFGVTGIEINKNEVDALIEKISQLKLNKKIKVYNKNIKKTSFKDDFFPAAIMQGILSALTKSDRDVCLKEIYRILKPNGYVHVAEFELISDDKEAITRYKNDEIITEEFGTLSVCDKVGKEMYRTHNFSKDELIELLLRNKFRIVSIKSQFFTSYHGNKKPGLLIIAQKF